MYTEEERAKWRKMFKLWKETGESPWDAGIRKEQPDATTVQRQEPVQPIKRDFIAEAQRKHAAEAVSPDTRSSYQRKQSLVAKLYANQQYQKAKDDAKRAEGMELLMKTISPSTYVEAATGLDLGTAGRLAADLAIGGVTAIPKRISNKVIKDAAHKAALVIENYRYPLGRPQVPENFLTIKPQIRTRVGDVEINNPQLAYRQGGNGIVEDFINSGKVRTKENHDIVDIGKGFTFDFGHTYSEPMFAQGRLNWGLPVGNNAQNTGLLTTSELLGVGNRQSRLVDNVVNGTTDIRMFPTRSRGVTGRVPLSEDQLNTVNTTAYNWEPGYGYRKVIAEESPYKSTLFRYTNKK